jgi:branched-subunit amino acid aminotransferase/4-amino-4-deoxychorismate lyase
MVNILFKKSYQHKPFKKIPFDDLWNKKGIFTTIRVIGKPRKFLFMEEHLSNLNQSIKTLFIGIQIDKFFLNNIIYKLFKNNIYYDHLFRIAITNKKISFSLRKRLKIKTKFKGILVSYKRPNWRLKHLQYNKILTFLKNINSQSQEIILTKNNFILEGATTNILYVANNTIYIPKNGYYLGITLQFFLKHSKRKIIKKDITKTQLKGCDEIILVGSGKGVVNLENIPQIHWHKNSNTIFNEFHKMYKSYISKQIATK